MRRRRGVLLLAVALVGLGVNASYAEAGGHQPVHALADQCGTVRSGDSPIGSAEVTLYQAGDRPGAAAVPLAGARTDAEGRFHLPYRRPSDPRAVLYLLAEGGDDGAGHGISGHGISGHDASGHDASGHDASVHDGAVHGPAGPVRLATVLGTPREWSEVVINERTTVAAAYALAQFAGDAGISGSYPGLQNAAAISHNLADITSGDVARVLATPPNGTLTSTLSEFNTLADILAACVDGQTCGALSHLAHQPGKTEPRDTFQAAVDIAHSPGNHVGELFALAAVKPLYQPALSAAPDAWTLALRYAGNGHELDGPGNIAFDADGNAWVTNNYRFAADPRTSVCGSRSLLRFTPTGEDAPGAPYQGGGLYGAGFGITLDPKGDVWVGNFGFQGSACELDPSRFYRSVSQFGPDGGAKSPSSGWRSGDIVQPQGTVSDRDGNIWIANCGGRSVTVFPHGDPR